MPLLPRFLVLALIGTTGFSADRQAPSYSASSVVNSASSQAGSFAPNTFLTIYGKNLAYNTRAMAGSDIRDNHLPTILPATGVTVYLNHIKVHVYYVSPEQINVLIPSDAYPGAGELQLTLDGVFGPAIPIQVQATAPALFQLDAATPIAVHADASLITPAAPCRPGEVVVLYATGLGPTVPNPAYGEIPITAAQLRDRVNFKVLLDNEPVDPARIDYAGVAPGFAGLYQINVRLPDTVGANPEIRLQAGAFTSKTDLHLPLRP